MKSGPGIYERFMETRKRTLEICSALERDDYMIQATEETSPPKWHLGHTTWFFETFVLKKHLKGYKEFNEKFSDIFNSYYNAVGYFLPKSRRMLLSRPSLDLILQYRLYVESKIEAMFHGKQKAKTLSITKDVDDVFLERVLTSIYISYFDILTIKTTKLMEQKIREAVKRFARRVMGVEIFEESSNSIVLQN